MPQYELTAMSDDRLSYIFNTKWMLVIGKITHRICIIKLEKFNSSEHGKYGIELNNDRKY
jgi:hypothetical protein